MGPAAALVLGMALLAAAVVVLLVATGVIGGDRAAVARSLAAMGARTTPDRVRHESAVPARQRIGSAVLSWFARSGRLLAPDSHTARIRRQLDLAGNPTGMDVDHVLAYKMLGLLLGVVTGIALPLLLDQGELVTVGCTIVGGVAGFLLPNVALYQLAYNRTESLRADLPDSLDLLTISVEAGLSFDAALAEVARNTTGPLAGEFFRVLQEMQIGVGRGAAIRSMGDRTDLLELRQFSTAMVQADTLGIPIAAVLRVQSREMRIKRSQRAEEQAQKVPVKILFPLIFCILPTLFLFILGPAVISISKALFGLDQ
jgi:tight adherence protein C